EPQALRTAELTAMMVQLVASGRGVTALPNWALTEYLQMNLLAAVPLGEEGVWRTLYAAVRVEDEEAPYIQDFFKLARERCFRSEPQALRTAELTAMMVQLVASGRGVTALPNWALTEYLQMNLLAAVPLGEEGVWRTLYAAVRVEDEEAPYIQDFFKLARERCF